MAKLPSYITNISYDAISVAMTLYQEDIEKTQVTSSFNPVTISFISLQEY